MFKLDVDQNNLAKYLAVEVVKIFDQRTYIEYQASNLKSTWYTNVFSIASKLSFDNIAEIEKQNYQVFKKMIEDSFDTFVQSVQLASNDKEEHVQNNFEIFFTHLNTNYFHSMDSQCSVIYGNRLVEGIVENVLEKDTLRDCVVRGKPDASLLFHDHGFLIVELKRRDMVLRPDQQYQLSGEYKSACAQLVFYMKAEIDQLYKEYNYIPEQYAGVLTNGVDWTILFCETEIDNMNKLKYHWQRRQVITYVPQYGFDGRLMESREREIIIRSLYNVCLIARKNLEEFKSRLLDDSFANISLNNNSNSGNDNSQKKNNNNSKPTSKKESKNKSNSSSGGKSNSNNNNNNTKKTALALTSENLQNRQKLVDKERYGKYYPILKNLLYQKRYVTIDAENFDFS